ncbi:MAG TPA: SLC13/DASS family transporter, partial [Planctomycetes bacterium]|nr:SLC13/DASS family transporter [Planctomycetota bacterium]
MGTGRGLALLPGFSWGFWLGVLLFAAVLFLPATASFPPAQRNILALTLLMGAWWMTEAIPLGATALLPLAFYPLLGIMTTKQVSPNYANHLVFLFLGGFLIALAMQEWGLHKRIALRTIALMGSGPRKLVFGFMAASAFLSMWISNTATTIMLLPIGLGVLRKIQGEKAGQGEFRYGMILMLGIAYSASVGGIATLVGTPPNLVFSGIFSQFFPKQPEVTFTRWFILVAPLTLLFFLCLVLFLVFVLLRPKDLPPLPGKEFIQKELKKMGPITPPQKIVLAVFAATALLWIFRADIRVGSFVIP